MASDKMDHQFNNAQLSTPLQFLYYMQFDEIQYEYSSENAVFILWKHQVKQFPLNTMLPETWISNCHEMFTKQNRYFLKWNASATSTKNTMALEVFWIIIQI